MFLISVAVCWHPRDADCLSISRTSCAPLGRMSRHEKWYSAGPHWLCCDTGARWHGLMSAPGYWHQEIPAEIGLESILTEECRETDVGWHPASDWSDWQQGRLLIGQEMQAGLPRSSLLEGWHSNGLTGYKENKKCCLCLLATRGQCRPLIGQDMISLSGKCDKY